jgi:peptidoglycan-associated lipoprotein
MASERRFFVGFVAMTGAAAVLLAAPGCAPKFPNCKTDEHCASADDNGGRLYCVNGTCQECTADAQCGVGKLCKAYRCEAKPECVADADCTGGLVCREQKCRAECLSQADCGANRACENQRCVAVMACRVDQDCGEGKLCEKGFCKAMAAEKACEIRPIHFEFDKAEIDNDNKKVLEGDVECLEKRKLKPLVVEGNCDERGTTEYNINLGFSRANAVKRYLEVRGFKGVKATSFGEERPVCREPTETCWQKNRRDDIVAN